MVTKPTSIEWYRPDPHDLRRMIDSRAGLTVAAAEILLPETRPQLDPVIQTLLSVGVPIAEGATTAKEHAIHLLKFAAEVEHALMAQYLYTYMSVVNGSPAVDHAREILNVAIQEMGHLATVQNILLLLGGPDELHLERDLYRKNNPKNPLPFVVEPVSRATLAKDVAAEMPAEVPDNLKAEVAELVTLAKQSAGAALHRVGAIYAMLRWIFLPAVRADAWADLSFAPLPAKPHVTDADLMPAAEVAKYQARPDIEWQTGVENFILETPHTCAEVVAALDKIAAQGEGLSQTEISHFNTFLGLVQALKAGEFTARPLATSPTLGADGAEGGEIIAHEYTREWGAAFSLQYTLLVLTIFHALRTPRTEDGSAGLRENLIGLALRAMRRTIVQLSGVCASLPMRDGSKALAGPPYDLDPMVLRAPAASEDLGKRHLALLDTLEAHYQRIEHSPEFTARPDDKNVLANLRSDDKRRRDLFSAPPPKA
jgi:hypothetical protein